MLAAIGAVSLKRWYHGPEFFWRAGKALRQAKGDPLCLHAEVFSHEGAYFALSVWHDVEAMLTFVQSNPHRGVMQAAPRLTSTYHFRHFACIAIPTRDQALTIWMNGSSAAE
ncbi:hypothetical protein [Ruegeria arenilitoris]|uniref:hypothetical protein n=1 Tax=Ruegeria arenilitoris TaxID=1173585 RepID=UPI00147C76D0|nr:hypothetical protein [Ruegeria arenilitoris]